MALDTGQGKKSGEILEDRPTHLVEFGILTQALCARWVEVAREDAEAAFLCRGDGEGAHACEPIAHDIFHIERVDESVVFALETGVPVDFGKVETEATVAFGEFDVEVGPSCQHLHLEEPELGIYRVDLVHHRLYGPVLVQHYLPDEMLVGEVLFPKVEVGWKRESKAEMARSEGNDEGLLYVRSASSGRAWAVRKPYRYDL